MGASQPGVFTFLFSDIEGSTHLWDSAPDAMTIALRRHDEILRSSIEGAAGTIFKTVGDSFCAVFRSPGDAAEAAESAQRAVAAEPWPPGAAIRVRIALHTGACEERDGDYFGATVNKVARIEDAAHGGQTLCSTQTAELLRGALHAQVEFVDLGAHELAGFADPERVCQLNFPGLAHEFPPLRIRRLTALSSNLPAERSSFVGRDAELDELESLVAAQRLVTLSGAGGIGKTRLAIEVARRFVGAMDEGVWLVELAGVLDEASVPNVVLARLGIGAKPGIDDVEVLVDILRDQHRVVVLDNCEHVLAACASLCDQLSKQCPSVHLLATSREPLRVEGEAVYRVPPLSLPPEGVEDAADLADSGAVALFVERARSQDPAFELRDGDAPAVASICRRLDGMPLALELATARLGSLSLQQIDRRLERRFQLLTGGSRTALPRHQTLRALIDWSFELLDAREQALFARLSVFQGGFDLEAAEAVCPLEDLDADEVADMVGSLVDKSLVTADVARPDVRYRLLESLRQYGAEKLAGDTDAARQVARCHATHFAAWFGALAERLGGPARAAWVARAREDEENLAAAAEELAAGRSADEASAAVALGMLGSTASYADSFRDYPRLCHLLDVALERAGDEVPGPRGAALYCKARMLLHRVEAGVTDCLVASAECARVAGDLATQAAALAFLAAREGDEEMGERAVAIAQELGDPHTVAMTLNRLGFACLVNGHHERGAAVLNESLSICRRLQDHLLEYLTRIVLSVLCLEGDDVAGARVHLEEMARVADLADPPLSMTCAFKMNLGWVELAEGDGVAASECFRDALHRSRLSGMTRAVPDAILGLACCARADGDDERAVVLHGAAAAALDRHARTWDALESGIRERDIAELRRSVGDRFDALYATMGDKDPSELVALAVAPAAGSRAPT